MTFILRGRRSIWWGWRVTLLTPRIGNDVSYVTQIIDDIHFAWQAQYLVKLECDFSWQAQQFVTFWEIAGARNVVIFHTKCVSKMGRVRSPKRRVGDDDFMVGLCSDYVRIILESSFYWRKQFRDSPLKCWEFRGRRGIWWGWRVTLLAPRIRNDVSYVSQITGDIHFVWHAQQLVKLEAASCCSAHCKWRFICHADQSRDSFLVAGAVFGEVGGWLCLLRALEMTFHMCRRSLMRFILRGRRSIWWASRLILLAARIWNDDSYVTQIIDDIHFAWQVQYLVRFQVDFACCAHWKWWFICDADHWWHSFCVAGAVFGEVGGWLLLRRAL